jgi:cell division protein FtsB
LPGERECVEMSSPTRRVRWDRLGRIAMGGVLLALAYLYLSAGVHIFSTWRQAHRDDATVATMQREHRQLASQHESLSKQSTLEAQARRLGMVKQGERPYIISGLPND